MSIFTNHLRFLFGEDTTFLRWLALTVQKPEERIPWVPVMISQHHGVGKGLLFQIIRLLHGEDNCTHIDSTEAQGYANGWLLNKVVWVGELDYQGYQQLASISLNSHMDIVRRYTFKLNQQKLACNIICTANHIGVRFPKHDNMRIINITAKPKDQDYYKELFAWLETSLNIVRLRKQLLKFNIIDENILSTHTGGPSHRLEHTVQPHFPEYFFQSDGEFAKGD